MSANNLKQIAFALHNYADSHGGRLPPAALCDERGRPLHSWRVLILPYIEEDDLFKRFRLQEPWDSPHNLALLPRMPRVYSAPRALPVKARADPSSTFYQVFVGKGTAFESTEGLLLPGDFTGGTSNTVLVLEAGEAVPWTRPVDLAWEAGRPLPPLGGIFTGEGRFSLFGPNRVKGFNVAFADGFVRFLGPEVREAKLREAIIRNGSKRLIDDVDW